MIYKKIDLTRKSSIKKNSDDLWNPVSGRWNKNTSANKRKIAEEIETSKEFYINPDEKSQSPKQEGKEITLTKFIKYDQLINPYATFDSLRSTVLLRGKKGKELWEELKKIKGQIDNNKIPDENSNYAILCAIVGEKETILNYLVDHEFKCNQYAYEFCETIENLQNKCKFYTILLQHQCNGFRDYFTKVCMDWIRLNETLKIRDNIKEQFMELGVFELFLKYSNVVIPNCSLLILVDTEEYYKIFNKYRYIYHDILGFMAQNDKQKYCSRFIKILDLSSSENLTRIYQNIDYLIPRQRTRSHFFILKIIKYMHSNKFSEYLKYIELNIINENLNTYQNSILREVGFLNAKPYLEKVLADDLVNLIKTY